MQHGADSWVAGGLLLLPCLRCCQAWFPLPHVAAACPPMQMAPPIRSSSQSSCSGERRWGRAGWQRRRAAAGVSGPWVNCSNLLAALDSAALLPSTPAPHHSLFFYAVGVGGEYPLASSSAAEKAEADPRLRHRRGEMVVLAFSGQGMGNFVNTLVRCWCAWSWSHGGKAGGLRLCGSPFAGPWQRQRRQRGSDRQAARHPVTLPIIGGTSRACAGHPAAAGLPGRHRHHQLQPGRAHLAAAGALLI